MPGFIKIAAVYANIDYCGAAFYTAQTALGNNLRKLRGSFFSQKFYLRKLHKHEFFWKQGTGNKGVGIIIGEYPPGVFFKGSQIFGQKIRSLKFLEENLRGLKSVSKFDQFFFQNFYWKIQIQTFEGLKKPCSNFTIQQ